MGPSVTPLFVSSQPALLAKTSLLPPVCSLCSIRSKQLHPFKSARTRRSPAIVMESNDATPPQKGEAPDGSTLTGALEISFRTVWIRLLTTGIGKEYDDAITAFIIATMAAYKAGYSVSALKFELSANERVTEYEGVNLALTDDEKQTRLIWISLIYITLASTKMPSERPVPPIRDDLKGTSIESFASGLIALVDSIREAERKGYTLESFKMEIALSQGTADRKTEPTEEEVRRAQAQANIRSQWSRIVFRTLAVLPEELKR